MHCVDVMSSDIYDKDREKCDDVRSIFRINTMNLDRFMHYRVVIVIRPVFVVLCYEFDALIDYGLPLI
jgi:hypothetical protein